MRGLHTKRRLPLALLLAASVAAAAVPVPAAAAVPDDGSSLVAWIGAWLARLAPEWVVAASESEEPPPPSDGIELDDPASGESCDPEIPGTCPGGEGWPDFDPDG